jgi:hypothetical protein
MAVNLGNSLLIMETDTQEVLSALKTEAFTDSAFGYLVEEIKSLSNLNLSSCECVFVSRVCNVAAHELAALGYVCTDGEEIISNSLPGSVAVIVANDLLARDK